MLGQSQRDIDYTMVVQEAQCAELDSQTEQADAEDTEASDEALATVTADAGEDAVEEAPVSAETGEEESDTAG